MDNLDRLLRSADPATRNERADDAARDLSARASELAQEPRRRRPSRPVVIGAVCALALAITAAATVFRPWDDAFTLVTLDLEVSGEQCSVMVLALPADGTTYPDGRGMVWGGETSETFDQGEFDAVEEFLQTFDWPTWFEPHEWRISAEPVTLPDGSPGVSIEVWPIAPLIEEELAAQGLNSGGSALIYDMLECRGDPTDPSASTTPSTDAQPSEPAPPARTEDDS